MKDFRDEYVTTDLFSDSVFTDSACGISDNINAQFIEKNKAVGLFNNERYVFGTTTEMAYDHMYIIDKLTAILGTPRFMITVDREYPRKVMGQIRPIHSEINPKGEFEIWVIKEILKESLEAFSKMPEDFAMRVDISEKLLDSSDIQLACSKNLDGLKLQIEHIIKL